ncbi:MAG: response regulator transcription factor [Kurthia sp.]|nr:response regulator transcription factor [Candidatus Kurthia equi]
MNSIFLIEDDIAIAEQIEQHFGHWNLQVTIASDFQQILHDFQILQPDLVIIDIQLPYFDGFHWCREIRLQSQVPIIFLSSRDQPLDMIMAMQLGADDYIQKPFHSDVLLSKVQAILRRTYEYSTHQTDSTLWNGATIDYASSILSYQNKELQLTKNEQFILKILLEHENEIVSRDDLMRRLWDDERFVNDNTLTVNVNRLRTKLKEIGLDDVIETKKGLGYMAIRKER